MKNELKEYKLLHLKEVVEMLGLSKSTLYKELNAGRLNPTYVGRRRLRFTFADLNAYIKLCNSKRI